MRTPGRFLLIAFCLLQAAAAGASGGGTSSAEFLLRPPGARATGMAEAYSSLGTDVGGITAIYYNPASAAYLRKPEFSVMGQRGFADDNYGSLYFGFPTTMYGTYGGGVQYYNAGDIELINTAGESRTVNAEQDLAAFFNYGTIYSGFASGINARILRSSLVDQFDAIAVAADLGAQARFLDDQVSVGLSVDNLGTQLQYHSVGEQIPLVVRGGASYRYPFIDGSHLIASMDGMFVRGENGKALIGFEYFLRNVVSLRAGYKAGQDIGKLSFGFGVVVAKVRIDYALTDADGLGKVHTASLTYKFEGNKDIIQQESY